MRKFAVVFVGVLGFAQLANAAACTDQALSQAQSSVKALKAQYDYGMASQYDILEAEKHLTELQLCNDPDNGDLFAQLVKNTQDRLKLADTMQDNGLVSPTLVTLISGEKAGLLQSCSALLPAEQTRYDNGIVTSQSFTAFKQACDSLKK